MGLVLTSAVMLTLPTTNLSEQPMKRGRPSHRHANALHAAVAAIPMLLGSLSPGSAARTADHETVPVEHPAPGQYVLSGYTSGARTAITYAPCILYPSVVYLRKSTGYRAVGVKPYTECHVPVTSIRQRTKLQRKYLFWWNTEATHSGGNAYEMSYTDRHVAYYCKSSATKKWKAVTTGTVLYAGRTYTSQVSTTVRELACGT